MAEQLTTPRGQTTVPAENDYGVLSDTKSTTQMTDNSPPTREEIQRVLQYLLSQNTPGVAENLMEKHLDQVAEVYWGPLVDGAIENWFAYVVALVFLLFRPQGLFGDKIIERV